MARSNPLSDVTSARSHPRHVRIPSRYLPVSKISQYPGEKEILISPLAGLDMRSMRVDGSTIIIDTTLSVNMLSRPIEQVVGLLRIASDCFWLLLNALAAHRQVSFRCLPFPSDAFRSLLMPSVPF